MEVKTESEAKPNVGLEVEGATVPPAMTQTIKERVELAFLEVWLCFV